MIALLEATASAPTTWADVAMTLVAISPLLLIAYLGLRD